MSAAWHRVVCVGVLIACAPASAYCYGLMRVFQETVGWNLITSARAAAFASCGVGLALALAVLPSSSLARSVRSRFAIAGAVAIIAGIVCGECWLLAEDHAFVSSTRGAATVVSRPRMWPFGHCQFVYNAGVVTSVT